MDDAITSTHSSRSRLTLLDVFPVELWFVIKGFIAEPDLPTHACLYAVSTPFVEFLYGTPDEQQEYWRNMCFQNGLGLLPGEDAETVDWTEIAMECMRDAFCGREGCGEKRLRKNASGMSYLGVHVTSWQGNTGTDVDPTRPAMNGVLRYLGFPQPKRDRGVIQDWDLTTLIDADYNIFSHPITRRSFVCLPPVQVLQLWPLRDELRNVNGATVGDLQAVMEREGLDRLLTIEKLGNLLEEVETEPDSFILQSRPLSPPPTIAEYVRTCSTLRGFFDAFRLSRFKPGYIFTTSDPQIQVGFAMFATFIPFDAVNTEDAPEYPAFIETKRISDI
ncbi:hypothetical protein BXZ70DRAFT_48238 [Cristinia sonorae]|uniref:Uncharacterized protein n=1 Tax=Cristinia sonorae TaxID=1940300 RepID=A0A8K0UQT4_9AGAR|nr:hypothetical protein BXZ70DRAFT_48238 [Cristinia sonorae]